MPIVTGAPASVALSLRAWTATCLRTPPSRRGAETGGRTGLGESRTRGGTLRFDARRRAAKHPARSGLDAQALDPGGSSSGPAGCRLPRSPSGSPSTRGGAAHLAATLALAAGSIRGWAAASATTPASAAASQSSWQMFPRPRMLWRSRNQAPYIESADGAASRLRSAGVAVASALLFLLAARAADLAEPVARLDRDPLDPGRPWPRSPGCSETLDVWFRPSTTGYAPGSVHGDGRRDATRALYRDLEPCRSLSVPTLESVAGATVMNRQPGRRSRAPGVRRAGTGPGEGRRCCAPTVWGVGGKRRDTTPFLSISRGVTLHRAEQARRRARNRRRTRLGSRRDPFSMTRCATHTLWAAC